MFSVVSVVSLAVSLTSFHDALALMVTSPSKTATWNLKGDNTVTWTSVATDPPFFDVVLVNHNANCASTGMSEVLKQHVASADGKCQISNVQNAKACDGYQINLVASTKSEPGNSTGILAQSAPFKGNDGPATAAPADAHGNVTASTNDSTMAPSSNNTAANSTGAPLAKPAPNSAAGSLYYHFGLNAGKAFASTAVSIMIAFFPLFSL